MLVIQELKVEIDNKKILNGINLSVGSGEIHAIMGPNGSGKSTLANVITGKLSDEVQGSVLFNGENLLELDPEERARQGIFLAFQHPIEIPGVKNIYLIKAAVNAVRRHRGQSEVDAIDFLKLTRDKMKLLEIDESFLYRSVNEGFSGGEKKRNEILQMIMLEPQLAVLDETDSGLDIDALKIVSRGVNSLADEGRSTIIVTHFPRILEYIVPDYVHVLVGGKFMRSGDKSLAHELERYGYSWVKEEVAQAVA
jgi:Fe-S cluster assembly ATP-binding protein